MKSIRVRAVLLMFILTIPVSVKAGILGTHELSGFGLLKPGIQPPQFGLLFALAGDANWACWNPGPSCPAILDQVLTVADIGSVYAFPPSNPNFAVVAGFLTDGIPGDWWSFAPDADAGGAVSSDVSQMLPPGRTDFAGDILSEIDLTVNHLSFSVIQLPSGIPPTLQPYTQATFDLAITVQGSNAPEPQSALLIGTPLLLVAVSRRVCKLPLRLQTSPRSK